MIGSSKAKRFDEIAIIFLKKTLQQLIVGIVKNEKAQQYEREN